LTPSTGSVEWAGGSADQQRAAQAMVFQRPILLRRSVRGNIEHALKARHIEKHERADRTEIVLQKTGLHNISNRNARVLSGGEQQRLALARAWALKPRVLFLDEPTANLDPAATAQVEQIIREMDQDQVRIMMVSHDLGQVRRVAVDVMFLHNGRLIEHSPAEHFFKTPETSLSAAFINGELLW
jgi:tungstate transport system ATP-binding protein